MARRGDEGVVDLLASLPSRARQLCLPSVGITAVGAAAIAETLARPGCNVRRVDLAANRLGDAGATALAAALPVAAVTTSLALGDNAIGVAGLAALASGLAAAEGRDGSSSLTALDLGSSLLDRRRHNRFGGGGLEPLVGILAASRLAHLTLRGCGVDRGASLLLSALAAAAPRLALLDLSSNPLGDAAASIAAAVLEARSTHAAGGCPPLQAIFSDVGVTSLLEPLLPGPLDFSDVLHAGHCRTGQQRRRTGGRCPAKPLCHRTARPRRKPHHRRWRGCPAAGDRLGQNWQRGAARSRQH
jgi:hypothetical protein